jgi:hypothetical protein
MSTKNPSFATFSFHGLSVEKKQGRRRGKERRRVKGEDSKHYLQASNQTASDHFDIAIPHAIALWVLVASTREFG